MSYEPGLGSDAAGKKENMEEGSPGPGPKRGDARSETRRQALAGALMATGMADRNAFQLLYRMTSAKLFGICLRICGERQAAEDVLQEVYLIIWRRASSFEPFRSSPITWLATIARNRAIDWRRAHRDRTAGATPGSDGEPAGDPVDPSPAADSAMIDDEEADRLRVCLQELGDGPRRAIHSAFLDGLTYSELARREGVPLPTMKSTVRRGLLQLRKCMNDDA